MEFMENGNLTQILDQLKEEGKLMPTSHIAYVILEVCFHFSAVLPVDSESYQLYS